MNRNLHGVNNFNDYSYDKLNKKISFSKLKINYDFSYFWKFPVEANEDFASKLQYIVANTVVVKKALMQLAEGAPFQHGGLVRIIIAAKNEQLVV